MKENDQTQTAALRLGRYVRTMRQGLRLSLSAASALADLDRTYWRRLEDGEYQQPSPRALDRIAHVIGAPTTELFVLAGYPIGGDLPGFGPYLRAKFHLPPDAIDQLERQFEFLRAQYGIPDDEPVFPPKSSSERGKTSQQRERQGRGAA